MKIHKSVRVNIHQEIDHHDDDSVFLTILMAAKISLFWLYLSNLLWPKIIKIFDIIHDNGLYHNNNYLNIHPRNDKHQVSE